MLNLFSTLSDVEKQGQCHVLKIATPGQFDTAERDFFFQNQFMLTQQMHGLDQRLHHLTIPNGAAEDRDNKKW